MLAYSSYTHAVQHIDTRALHNVRRDAARHTVLTPLSMRRKKQFLLVHGQVTIIFVVSVCLFVCLSVCLFVCLFVQSFYRATLC